MNETKSDTLQPSAETAKPTGIARRRLLRAGLAAAPVVLAVSGRSAMAATNCTAAKGLSPMAWASMAPKGTCIGSSHTIEGNALGRSPGFWTPNVGGSAQTFQGDLMWRWPVAPFDRVMTEINHVLVPRYWNSYPYNDFKGVAANDSGFNNGAKFSSVFGGSDSRSFSRILIAESASKNVKWHFCAAYLNCKAMPGTYAITETELKNLYTNKRLVAGGIVLSDSQIKTFLDQTWS